MNKYGIILFAILTTLTLFADAQNAEEVTLQWGDTLYFGECSGENYQYIDFFKKTRFEVDTIDFDTINGFPFFDVFTATGDFDVSRLSCTFRGKYAILKHMMALPQEDGSLVNVIIGMVENGVSMVYLINKAFTEGEILVAPTPR